MKNQLPAKIIEKFDTQADFALTMNTSEELVFRVVRGRRTLQPETQKAWANEPEFRKAVLEASSRLSLRAIARQSLSDEIVSSLRSSQ